MHWSVAFTLCMTQKEKVAYNIVVLMPWVQDIIIIFVNNLLFSISFMLQTKLFPTVHLFWKKYQANLLSQLKELGGITIAGDGRHDSMGHCAKYCAYTIFCCTFHLALSTLHLFRYIINWTVLLLYYHWCEYHVNVHVDSTTFCGLCIDHLCKILSVCIVSCYYSTVS